MQQRRCYQAFVPLLVVLLASACSAKQSGTFADWLATKKSAGASAAVQSEGYDYETREYVHQCLKETTYKNCRFPEEGGTQYFESGVTCCDARSHSGNSLGSSNIEVGTCKFKQFMLSAPINEAPGVSKYGEFEVQCYLNAASDTCGHPFCDQMVLEAAGGIYWAEDIVVTSRPVAPLVDDSCQQEKRTGSKPDPMMRMGGKKAGGIRPAGPGGSKVEVAKMSHPSEPSMFSGDAWIYFGPMSINSRVHDVKMTQGWFEYIWDYTLGTTPTVISEADAEGKHVIDPYTFSLKFYKPNAGSY